MSSPNRRLREQNILYDTPQSHLRRRKMLLRLRIETPANHHAPANPAKERVILTSKAPPQPQRNNRPSRYKIRAEREQVASISSRQYAKALTSLGFRPAFRYDKFRTTFRLQDLHLDLDETPAGVYLELEGTPKAIDRAAKALGFAKDAVPPCHLLGPLRRRMPSPRHKTKKYALQRKIILKIPTLRLTNFPSAFTSQLGPKLKHTSTTQWSCRPIRNPEVTAWPRKHHQLG